MIKHAHGSTPQSLFPYLACIHSSFDRATCRPYRTSRGSSSISLAAPPLSLAEARTTGVVVVFRALSRRQLDHAAPVSDAPLQPTSAGVKVMRSATATRAAVMKASDCRTPATNNNKATW